MAGIFAPADDVAAVTRSVLIRDNTLRLRTGFDDS